MLEKEISLLLSIEPYFGVLCQKCRIKWSEEIPTAGVRIMPQGVIEMIVNPEFYFLKTQHEKVGLIWHELLHLVANDVKNYIGLDPNRANIAMDEANNQYIKPQYLPKRAILPEFFKHERNKPFEYYYNLHLKRDDSQKYQQKKKYEGGLDNKAQKESLKDQIKRAVQKQVEIQTEKEHVLSQIKSKMG